MKTVLLHAFFLSTLYLLPLFLLPSSANALINLEEGNTTTTASATANNSKDGSGDASSVNGRTGPGLEWEILTKRDFSSQIRAHPHILLLVTVPWSGESRSLQKDLARLVSDNQEKLGSLRLMVVYRNSEKLLAEVLGASEEMTFFYYHHSKRFKYQGRMRAESILSSVSYLMSLQPEEVPLKSLKSEEELKVFLQSTDEAVLLLEFCGWSSGLLHKKDDGSIKGSFSAWNFSGNGKILGDNLPSRDETLLFSRNRNEDQKGMENEILTCGAENELNGIPWPGEVMWGNESASPLGPNGMDNNDTGCTMDDFLQFESFFTKFVKSAREIFLPPEKLRFGLISEKSLLPFLDIGSSDTWMFVHWVSGCPDCSNVHQEADDLKTTLQRQHSPVMELDGDQSNQYPALPASRPSIILFIDRSSKSSKVSDESKTALEIFRRFAKQNQISSQMIKGQQGANSGVDMVQGFPRKWSRSVSNAEALLKTKVPSSRRIVKFKDNMAVMIIDEGKRISLERRTGDSQDNSAYDILAQLLHRQNPELNFKEIKLSLLAKEVGFQLLSDDVEVKVADSLPLQEENQLCSNTKSGMMDNAQVSKTPWSPIENSIVYDPIYGKILTVAEDGIQPESDTVTSTSQHSQESIHEGPHSGSNTNTASFRSGQEASKGKICTFESAQAKEFDKCSKEKGDDSCTCYTKNSLYLEQHPSTPDRHIEKNHAHHIDNILNDVRYDGLVENSGHESFEVASAGGFVAQGKDSRGNQAEKQLDPSKFNGSFFFSDGGHRMFGALTGGSRVPSVVILDPILQQHYVLSEETKFSYSALASFIDRFLNGSLAPYQHSELVLASPRESPQPPFVNLDFHEADSIPRVTANTLSELILCFRQFNKGNQMPSSYDHNPICASKRDILVLFSNSWCGFCQRMELVVREVYRAFQGFLSMTKSGSMGRDINLKQDDLENLVLNMPSIFYVDCTLNDCGRSLKLLDKIELYPALLLLPAEKKDAVSYEGALSVNDLFEFLAAHGSNSQYLTGYKGILWTQWAKASERTDASLDTPYITIHERTVADDEYHESLLDSSLIEENHQPIVSQALSDFTEEGKHVVVGSILSATDKLLNAFPFVNSSILIVQMEKNEGLEGLIINKPISWDGFLELDETFEPLKPAPLFYGGPVRVQNLPLVSLARKATEGYLAVTEDVYYGDPYITKLTIEAIRSGNQLASDYWFFLGFSSWEWNQLFVEISAGVWDLINNHVGYLYWPES